MVIAAGLALSAGALIGSFDLMNTLHRFKLDHPDRVSAGPVNHSVRVQPTLEGSSP